MPMEDAADRPPFDAEPITELIYRRAGLIAGDQLLDQLVGELPSTPGPVSLGRRRFECVKAGELLAELFQGPDLVLQVVIGSPRVHRLLLDTQCRIELFRYLVRFLRCLISVVVGDEVQVSCPACAAALGTDAFSQRSAAPRAVSTVGCRALHV